MGPAGESRRAEKPKHLKNRMDFLQAREEARLLGRPREELTAHDPKPWFQKGWTKLSTTAGPVRSINQVSTGDPVRAVLEDGILDMTVNHREKRHPEEANE